MLVQRSSALTGSRYPGHLTHRQGRRYPARMPLDPAAAPIIELMEASFPRLPEAGEDAAALRARLEALPKVPITEEIAACEDRAIPGPTGDLPVRIYRPMTHPHDPLPGTVYFHGGGWVICGLDSHDGACRRLANAVNAVVVSVDYRLAPEHPYPAAVDDGYAALEWVTSHANELGIDPSRIAVAGDSAGGNIAAVVAQMARDRSGPSLAYQLLVYPVIDSTSTRNERPSRTENAEGYFLVLKQMEWYREMYVRDDTTGAEPYCSPHVAESLAGLPPACIVTAEMDLLRDEGEHYASVLEAAGVPVTMYRAPGMFHGFFNMHLVLDGAKDAQKVAFEAMRAGLETA